MHHLNSRSIFHFFLIDQRATFWFGFCPYIIDQVRGQDGWILTKFSFYVFMDRREVEVYKNAKREQSQYPAILTELAWSIKDLLYGIPRLHDTLWFYFAFAGFCRKMYWSSSTFFLSLFSFSLTLSVFSFFLFPPDREITENLFTVTENILRNLVHSLGLRRNVREITQPRQRRQQECHKFT